MQRHPNLSQRVYDARRAKALLILFDILFVLIVALALLPTSKDNPRTGTAVEVAAQD